MSDEPWTRDVSSPIGAIRLAADDAALVRIVLPDERGSRPAARGAAGHPVLDRAAEEIEQWFAGERRSFDLPLRAEGTAFQQQVWAALATIPYGAVWSYGDLARRIGRPRAVRAVGAANGRNPLPIVVPCHRVIGASGALTGFGGGLRAKAWLLDHERRATGLSSLVR
jgi:methylated-DNA-[protein]-cysteine S-methyltransferase